MSIRCIFCDFVADSLPSLKSHSAACSEHPAVKELADWNETVKFIMTEPCDPAERHCTCVPPLKRQLKQLRAVLFRIATWFGEFPETGRTLENGEPMSYGAVNGSNGERDYMRRLAEEALR